ncbi:MAG TPA: carboxypeptidase regulatory-like domain-containing protein [Gemmatimonadales bacterium]|nr:carboxypeptidase regulatory-like domain-containing protein [Gemmatimonadales bacterium]
MSAVAVIALLASMQVPPPAPAIDAGRLEGTARIAPRLNSTRMRVRVYNEPGDLGAAAVSPPTGGNPFANVVLYLEDAAGLKALAPPESSTAPAMRQHDERFTPHVLAVTTGTSVSFPNDDPIYHNVFSLSRARTFDLGRYPKGETKFLRFDRTGVVQVFCHIHADMNGYILVLPNHYFVTPDSAGRFVLDGIPPGEYQLIAWHERIRPISTPVHVSAGQTTTLEVSIPLTEPTKP